jgi:conjugative transfer signal peptidase TraF
MTRRRCFAGVIAMAGVLGGVAAAGAAGVRWNGSASMPRGLWLVAPADGAPRRGQTVAVCPPDAPVTREAAHRGYRPSGRCPDGLAPLLKIIAAAAGDVVTVTPAGIAVNGAPAGNTAPLGQDSAGRPLRPFPPGVYPVPPGQIWLLSRDNPRGFDSRYFGPVPAGGVRGVARPLWVSG